MTAGKTTRILQRLPHFFAEDLVGDALLQVIDTWGSRLELSEADLYRVMHAHHMQTADNVGSAGYTAKVDEQGDLDKLFSLYLEELGGTSQLVKLNPEFTIRSLDARKLFDALWSQSLADVLTEAGARAFDGFREANAVLEGADVEQAFVAELLGTDAAGLVSDRHGFVVLAILYSFGPDAFQDLVSYRAEELLFTPDEISGNLVFDLLLGRSDLGVSIAAMMTDEVKTVLNTFDGAEPSTELRRALADFLNRQVLRDPAFYKRNYELFENYYFCPSTLRLRDSLYRDFLKGKVRSAFAADPAGFSNDVATRDKALAALDSVELAPSPAGDEVIRLNRRLLDEADLQCTDLKLKWGLRTRNLPSYRELRQTLADQLNDLLAPADHGKEQLMRRLFSKRVMGPLTQDYDNIVESHGDDTRSMRRRLLEEVFPIEVEKNYASYHKRLSALVRVLREGASTRQGILDIIAANLGIVDTDPESLAARELIEIIEYNPKPKTFLDRNLGFYECATIVNDTQDPLTPDLRISILDAEVMHLSNLRLVDEGAGRELLLPVQMNKGDVLFIHAGEPYLNGVQLRQMVDASFATVPAKSSVTWRFEADAKLLPNGRYRDPGQFDVTRFGDSFSPVDSIFLRRESVVRLEAMSEEPTYGTFTVRIPWDIPGFTDKFAETKDHPRHQILGLVNRVKAAGVTAAVDYTTYFSEDQDPRDRLDFRVSGPAFNEAQPQDVEQFFAGRDHRSETHDIDDGLKLDGVLDYSKFNSANRFA